MLAVLRVRSFDEARGLNDVYGWAEPAEPRRLALKAWGRVGEDWRWPLAHGMLHLLGYDHGDEMELRERELLQ